MHTHTHTLSFSLSSVIRLSPWNFVCPTREYARVDTISRATMTVTFDAGGIKPKAARINISDNCKSVEESRACDVTMKRAKPWISSDLGFSLLRYFNPCPNPTYLQMFKWHFITQNLTRLFALELEYIFFIGLEQKFLAFFSLKLYLQYFRRKWIRFKF